VWSWRPDAGAKLCETLQRSCEAMGARKPGPQGEREVSRKPLCREGRCDSACTCGLRAFAQCFCAKAHGCMRAPGLPCALRLRRGQARCKTRAKTAARIRRRVIFALRKSNGNFCGQSIHESDRLAPLAARATAYGPSEPEQDASSSSWPGLSRPSTLFSRGNQDVDARDKPGHDEFVEPPTA
jgi:hypothetical protein